jgi:hypothetical protein
MSQTNEEVLRIVDDWGRNLCPADMVQNERNGKLLLDYCWTQFGVVTAGGLTHAYNAVRDKLELVPAPPAPKVKTAEELAQEEILRQNRDYLDSIKPQPDFSAKMREVQRKKDEEKATKAQADAKGQLAVAISGYQCYRISGSGVDYTGTELMQKELSTVVSRLPNGQRDYVRNLAAVRQIISELPDHPQVADVARTLESINARSVKSHQPKDSFGDEVREVGKLGGLR